MHDPKDPHGPLRPRDDLPDVRGKKRRPAGYRAGFQWEERLVGLALLAVGIGGLFFAAFLLSTSNPARVAPVLGVVPILMALGGVGMIGVGIKQILNP